MFERVFKNIYKSKSKLNIRAKLFCTVAAAAILLPGCGSIETSENLIQGQWQHVTQESFSMENEAVLDYEIPKMNPGILVDRNGYSSNEIVTAFIYSGKLPEEYLLLDPEGNEVLRCRAGEAILKKDEGKFFARLCIPESVADGEYSISGGEIGNSFSFRVSDTFYRDKYWKLIEDECEKIKLGDADVWEVFSVLYSYERYKEVLFAEKDDAPDVLDAVGEWISLSDIDSFSAEEKYVYIALLSRFGYNYKSVQEKLATECIQKASAVYKEAQSTRTGESDEERNARFLAIEELYRTSGSSSYAKEILNMGEYLTGDDDLYDSGYILYGAMGYMTTRSYVDRNLCDKLMENLLFRCRDLNDNKKLISISNDPGEDGEQMLKYAQQFAAMNYILDGYEYNEQILNIVHYLSGRNTGAVCYEFDKKNPADAVAIYAWLAWLENNGKLDPSAPVIWNYSW